MTKPTQLNNREISDFFETGAIHRAISDLENIQVGEIPLEYQERICLIANQIAQSRLAQGEKITSPDHSRKALQTLLQDKQEEVMAVLFLDSKHTMISFEELFHGTIDSASIYTRVLVKRVLKYNSSAIVLAHNHPSGVCFPSEADKSITNRIKKAMELIDVKLLDHFIVSPTGMYSFAEYGQV